MPDESTSSAATLDVATAPAPKPAGPLRLALQALLLDDRAFAAVAADRSPLRRGVIILSVILAVVAVVRLIGLGLGLLTAPQLDPLQKLIFDFIVGLPWYAEQVQLAPGFAGQFAQTYALAWEGLRLLFGIPTPGGTILAIVGLVLLTFVAWFVYGTLAHWLARWFGGQARFGQFLGVSALAYAPLLLIVVELVPGATLPASLVFFALLVTKYLAVKQAHGLGSGYAAAATLGPYVVVLMLLLGLLLFGAAFGIQQIPFFTNSPPTSRLLLGALL